MNRFSTSFRSMAPGLRGVLPSLWLSLALALAACGGGADAPPPPESAPTPTPAGVAPNITQQPANASVTAGQPASFIVAATGTAPLAYQWQRNGSAITGATGPTYTLGSTALADSGVVFRAIVTNSFGSATSANATLTITAAAPVLTITPQPASTTVVAGAAAAFTVGGTCSTGTLTIQWQRLGGSAFADIAGATSTTYSFSAATTDTGAQFRAALSCSGQAATVSNTATLTVTAPGGATLSLYTVNGLRDQARINGVQAIDQLPDGSWVMTVNTQIERLAADRLSITTIAGNGSGSTDGPAATARFSISLGITHDAAGALYVADSQNHTIRKIAVDGTVSTLAGTAGQSGLVDGTGAAARFSFPWGITMGPDGALYVADHDNSVIRRVTTAGVVTTYAGTGAVGYLDGPAATALLRGPQGVTAAANGDIIVSDSSNQRVRRILRAGSAAGMVETLAGSGASTSPGIDGIGVAAVIPAPSGIVLSGNAVFVRDASGLIRQIDLTTRAVTTFAGSRALGAGDADGPLGIGRLADSGAGVGLTTGTGGGLLAADRIALRSVDAAGALTTIAAQNGFETTAGTGVLVQLPLQAGKVAVDSAGRIANYDLASAAVRRIDASGNVTLTAGLTGSLYAVVDGAGSIAQFGSAGLSITGAPGNVLYVGDTYVLRRIASDGTVTTLAGSTSEFGAVDGPSATARFNNVVGLAVAPNGDVFVADPGNHAIRRVDAAGNVTTYAGVLGQSGRVDGAIAAARLQFPSALTVTPDGTLWFADGTPGSEAMRKVSPDGSTVSTLLNASPTTGIAAVTSDAAGTVYYIANADLVLAGGLFSYVPSTNVATRIISSGVDQTLHLGTGSAAGLPVVRSLAVLGSSRLVLSSSAGQLLLVTLP